MGAAVFAWTADRRRQTRGRELGRSGFKGRATLVRAAKGMERVARAKFDVNEPINYCVPAVPAAGFRRVLTRKAADDRATATGLLAVQGFPDP